MEPLRIVVGFDGSEDSRRALAWAKAVAAGLEPPAELYLAAAMGLLFLPRFPESASVDSVLDEQEKTIRDQLEAAAEAARTEGLAVETHLRRWFPSETILDAARERGAALIVVGSHGGGWRERLLVGSVSLEVVHRAELPVLVARGERQARSPERVLVGVDGSPHSVRALEAARRWFPGARILAVGVHDGKDGPDEKRLEAAIGTADLNPNDVDGRILEGHAASVLLEVASEGDVDVLVVGRRGLGGLKQLVLGSVSERLLQLAPCPVMVTH